MNKELREDLEHLIICNDKTITQDLRDDVKMTLDYIDELENKIDKAIEYIDEMCLCSSGYSNYGDDLSPKYLINILRGKDNE